MSEFTKWFYSADHRKKYDNTHPAFLAAGDAWLKQLQELTRQQEEIARLREALEYYANESHWSEHPEYENASCFDAKRPEKMAQKALNNES